MSVGDPRANALGKIRQLAAEPRDLVRLWQESTGVLTETVPHYMVPCWYSLDPASLLITSHYHDGMPEFPQEWLNGEYYAEDVNQLAQVAKSPDGLATLHESVRDPSQSPRWRQNMEMGADQELVLALRSKSGEVWGALGLYREPDRPMFDDGERKFLRAMAPALAAGVRRALLIGEATDPEGPDAPGLLVLTDDGIESTTPGVEHWLSQLPDGDWEKGRLPTSIQSVAARARRTAAFPDVPGEVAMARVLSRSGRWIVLHGAALVSTGEPRVAVIVEPAHPARIFPLLASAYGLTDRETDLARLVLEGYSTAQIAEEFVVSPHTVQQHLKSIFEKTGVRSRRDLVGRIFFTHYEPRFRDNEKRVARGKPVRGGPASP